MKVPQINHGIIIYIQIKTLRDEVHKPFKSRGFSKIYCRDFFLVNVLLCLKRTCSIKFMLNARDMAPFSKFKKNGGRC